MRHYRPMRVNWDFKNFSASDWMRAKSTPSSHGNLWHRMALFYHHRGFVQKVWILHRKSRPRAPNYSEQASDRRRLIISEFDYP